MNDMEVDCHCEPGAPAWIMTFADLMSLLMSFFVLLLSFSEMDRLKFKELAGSLANAFGVQREINAKEPPKGTSLIAREFSPGTPDKTLINEVRQNTVRENQRDLDLKKSQTNNVIQNAEMNIDTAEKLARANEEKKAKEKAAKLKEALDKEIKKDEIEVEAIGDKVVIRILEKGSFTSGSADLETDFLVAMGKIRAVLDQVKGDITVSGHTDDIPIATDRFRSNWELSAARAVSVAHELMKEQLLAPSRFVIIGFADQRPLTTNDTALGRSKNRRVEVMISGKDGEAMKKALGAKPQVQDRSFEDIKLETGPVPSSSGSSLGSGGLANPSASPSTGNRGPVGKKVGSNSSSQADPDGGPSGDIDEPIAPTGPPGLDVKWQDGLPMPGHLE